MAFGSLIRIAEVAIMGIKSTNKTFKYKITKCRQKNKRKGNSNHNRKIQGTSHHSELVIYNRKNQKRVTFKYS